MNNERTLPTSTKGAVQRSRTAESIEVTFKPLYLINKSIFLGNVLEAHMQEGVLLVANVIGFRGVF